MIRTSLTLNFYFTSLIEYPSYEDISFSAMVMQGLDYDKILDRMRESSGGSTRVALLEKDDIKNVAQKLGLGKTQRLHSNDSISVRLTVNEMRANNEILFFKDQGEVHPNISKDEFVLCFQTSEQCTVVRQLHLNSKKLICMDSTHGIS